jgi:perosamine synthetase
VIPLAVPNLGGREADYLQECITSTFVSTVGPFVERFERAVADAAGASGGLATSTGTAGLHVALRALRVGRDDLVVLPTLTFVASANAIAYCGADPWLFDVSPDSWTLDPERLTLAFERDVEMTARGAVHVPSGRRVAAILAVHTLGHPVDLDPITALAERFAVPVVADAAAALGATYRGRAIGQAGARVSIFSFNGNKTVTAGGGGALASNDAELLTRARHLSTTARVGQDYDHDEVGFNYRMTNVQAAVGCAQLEQLEVFVARKRQVDAIYREELAGYAGVEPFPAAEWAESACWFSGVVLPKWSPEAVLELREDLRAEGIDARPFWKPMHLQKPFRDAPRDDTRFSDSLWSHVVTLPCSTGITDSELETVVAAISSRLAP